MVMLLLNQKKKKMINHCPCLYCLEIMFQKKFNGHFHAKYASGAIHNAITCN